METLKIGVVADDFTGTASAGAMAVRTGVRTGLFLDAESLSRLRSADRPEAAYVSSNSRHLPPGAAAAAVRAATRTLLSLGVQQLSKKIDSTLRGGIGWETDAMLSCMGGEAVALVVPALPATRRVCVGGYALVDGVVLTETPVARDVKTPVTESFVPRLLQAQTRERVSHVGLGELLAGQERLLAALRAARAGGGRVIVADAVTDAHIDAVAQAVTALGWPVLAVDPGPFTVALARARGLIGGKRPAPVTADGAQARPALFVVGSANSSTGRQIERLLAARPGVRRVSVSPLALVSGGEAAERETARAAALAIALMADSEAVVLETALHGEPLDLGAEDARLGLASGGSSARINSGLAEITARVLDAVGRRALSGLLLTGGDTMESVCRRLGVGCIEALESIQPMVDVGRALDGCEGLPLVMKGGFCGGEDVGLRILEHFRPTGGPSGL